MPLANGRLQLLYHNHLHELCVAATAAAPTTDCDKGPNQRLNYNFLWFSEHQHAPVPLTTHIISGLSLHSTVQLRHRVLMELVLWTIYMPALLVGCR